MDVVYSEVNVVSANVQEQDAFHIEKDEFDPVRIVDPKGIGIFFFTVELVSFQHRVEGIFPKGTFLISWLPPSPVSEVSDSASETGLLPGWS
jgi:hypothetical protein